MPRSILPAMQLALLAVPAMASWPTSPDDPLIIGLAPGGFGARTAVVVTDDQAVWAAWQDNFCVGSLRLQRIASDGTLLTPQGLDVQDDPTCGTLQPPSLSAFGHSVAVARALAASESHPVLAFSSSGDALWPVGSPTETGDTIAALARLANDDTLIVTTGFRTIYLDRITPGGEPVWADSAAITPPGGANFRVFAVVADPTGGAYVFWDSPLPYVRTIFVQRVNADGSLAWPAPVRPIPEPPLQGNSRHTDPIALADGAGNAWLVWTEGEENGLTPVPTRVQRIGPDASLAFPIEGLRVSLDTARQFEPRASVDPKTGDLIVAWLDGVFTESEIRVQRLSPQGERLWTDNGGAIAPSQGEFELAFWNGHATVAAGGPDGLEMHMISPDGVPAEPWVLSEEPAGSVRIAPSLGGAVVVWPRVGVPLEADLVAIRVNPDGRLGNPACAPADLAEPFFVLDLADLGAFVTAFTSGDALADLSAPFGVLDLADVQAFVESFTQGCP